MRELISGILMVGTENKNLISRQPVVVVLGHVDSGKTSILDSIRKTHIAEKEAGGITQHIGAYEIALPAGGQEKGGKKITFIDTPGHEAFSAMRSRGAKVADIAVLVVDGIQGVQPQTKEAIGHIKKSGLHPIVVINKVDFPTADPQKIKNELAKEDFLVESMGGKIPSVNVSAKTGQGIEDLSELIILVAEMENLKADLARPAEGVIIEAFLDSQRGPTATLILENGILNQGDIIATPSAFGKIKLLEDFQGNQIGKAMPSQPVIVMGFENAPGMGEKFKVFPDLETARSFLKVVKMREIPRALEIGLEQRVLNLILKADVLGSLEAIEGVLKEIPQEKVILRILKSEVGEINESDIKLAKSGRAIILGFRVKTNPPVKGLAERERIKIMNFEVIYDLVEGVRKIMESVLRPEVIRVDLGKIKILAVFLKEKNRQIIGGRVMEGEIEKGSQIEVLRNEEMVGRGKLVNLQKNKKNTERVGKGEECGLLFEGEVLIGEGDIFNAFKEERQKGEL